MQKDIGEQGQAYKLQKKNLTLSSAVPNMSNKPYNYFDRRLSTRSGFSSNGLNYHLGQRPEAGFLVERGQSEEKSCVDYLPQLV